MREISNKLLEKIHEVLNPRKTNIDIQNDVLFYKYLLSNMPVFSV